MVKEVSVLYISGLGAKVRPPCFDSGCYSRESWASRPCRRVSGCLLFNLLVLGRR
nr:MAG TPA: hypothetical protein [Caudoviricetes sp.]